MRSRLDLGSSPTRVDIFQSLLRYEAQEADVQEALSPAGEVAGVRILRNGQKGSIAPHGHETGLLYLSAYHSLGL